MKKILILIGLVSGQFALAQTGQVIEEVVAIVGENIILKSDLETEYLQAKSETGMFVGDLKCAVLNQLIIQKLYLHKGARDSVYADDSRVDAEVDRRIQYYASQVGGEANLEKYLGKPISEYRETIRSRVADQMVIQQVQQSLISDVKATPTDVRKYFNSIPKDSIPKMEEEVELAHVTMDAQPSDFAKEYAYKKLVEIREKLIAGEYSFEFAAESYSDDKGTAVNGGELGFFTRGQMVSAFEREAFKLRPDTISPIIETEYGYHILQLIDRMGERVNVRHVLIKPRVLPSDYAALLKKMNEVLFQLKADSTTLCKVAADYSSDENTSGNCGYLSNPSTGALQLPISLLDQSMRQTVDGMKAGDYSKPEQVSNYDGTRSYRFYYLKSRIPEHEANLRQDYQKIQSLAEAQLQDQAVADWVEVYKDGVYVWIDEKYVDCSELTNWKKVTN